VRTKAFIDHGGPPITGSDHFVTLLIKYSCCTLYSQSTVIHDGLNIPTSNHMLCFIAAGSGLTDDFELYILGHNSGGCIGSITVD
jgi:hypothetical protein